MFIFSTHAFDACFMLTRLTNINEGLVGCYVKLSQVVSNSIQAIYFQTLLCCTSSVKLTTEILGKEQQLFSQIIF